MEEIFDVLNEKGEYTGRVETREKCHREGLWHKAVAMFIINSKNQVLLQKRSVTKKLWPNMWDITAGGHVFTGEFGFEAVIRELKEELGIEVNKNDLTFIGSSISSNIKEYIINNHFNEYYIVHKDIDKSDVTLQEEEVSEVEWMNKEEIIKRVKDNYNGITDKEGCWEYLVKYYEWLEKIDNIN
ncbi:MAG TPA: NUDIX domain-containing protein [Candidatus Merdicola faecigallinarum]|uniref:NUDIX domain-containing protein n=1 Tax=Candidatus Merdicola faecigallinarum TaxID=2840862 RepID=A0A9D1M1F6_9FIRM|nr:NUDIX domain-containing protein [Candidatus Merdicola faecigallinarum]